MKSYRFFGDEMEVLGTRMDHARERIKQSTTEWSRNYWAQTLERLLFQWRQLPILHDGEAQTTIIPRWTVDYEFYEKAEYTGHGIADRAYNTIFRDSANLEESWNNHRAQRLARAQF